MVDLSLDTAAKHSVWTRLRSRGIDLARHLSRATEQFWLSRWYFPAMLLAAVGFAAANQQVAGVGVLLCLAAWFTAFCPDLLSCVCPLAMVFLMAGPCYADLSIFFPCAILLLPLLAALLLHLVIWPVTLRAGRSARGLVLVSVATLLGGCDVMQQSEFWRPLSLYYTLGLGVMLLVIYLLFRSCLAEEHGDDLPARFGGIFYTLGLLMAAEVFCTYLWRWQEFVDAGALLFLNYRNFAATILLTTLPMTLYFALRSRKHLAVTAVLLLAMVLTGSRSALLFGAVEVVVGCIYLVRYGAVSRKAMLTVTVVFAAVMAVFGIRVVGTLYADRIANGLISKGELRWKLLDCGINDFLRHPVFGMGLGNTANCEMLESVKGSMFFYHNLPLQVLASMGLVGLVAYGCLIVDRIALLLKKRSAFTMALGMCYLGMLLVSMTNPGEFCPLPNAGLMVIVFAMVEEATGDATVPVTRPLGVRRHSRRTRSVTYAHK
ncbi:MAG: O-antigen ligase family protein [Clostridiales bacterium]|nr:O-antigen ligase family protein [Candidatus Cacconaster stercorequi]